MNLLITIITALLLAYLWSRINNHMHRKDYEIKRNLVVAHIFARKMKMPEISLHEVEKIALCDLLKETIATKNKRGYDNIRLIIMTEFPQHVEAVMAHEVNLGMGHFGYSDNEIIKINRDFKEIQTLAQIKQQSN